MKQFISKTGLILIGCAILMSGIISAVQASRFIDRFDEDFDGVVTMDEFPGPDRIFEKIDSDGDGIITEAEAEKVPLERKAGKGFIHWFDQDGDQLVSLDEFPKTEDLFRMLDTDGNGFISEDETPPHHLHLEKHHHRE